LYIILFNNKILEEDIKMAKMVIGLFSGSIDRLIAAGIVSSGAAALDMDIEIYVLLMGARAFKKGN
jgi:peroxiredoxin family protein